MIDRKSMRLMNSIQSNLKHSLPVNEYVEDLRKLVQIKPLQKQIIHFFLSNNVYQDYQIPHVIMNRYNDRKLAKVYGEEAIEAPFDFYRTVGKDIHPFGRLEALYLLDVLHSNIYKQQAKEQSREFERSGQMQGELSRSIVDSNFDTRLSLEHESIFVRMFKGLRKFLRDFFWE